MTKRNSKQSAVWTESQALDQLHYWTEVAGKVPREIWRRTPEDKVILAGARRCLQRMEAQFPAACREADAIVARQKKLPARKPNATPLKLDGLNDVERAYAENVPTAFPLYARFSASEYLESLGIEEAGASATRADLIATLCDLRARWAWKLTEKPKYQSLLRESERAIDSPNGGVFEMGLDCVKRVVRDFRAAIFDETNNANTYRPPNN